MRLVAEYRSGISGTTTYLSVTANECIHPGMGPPRQSTLPITFLSLLPDAILTTR
jgi:hypothetical protein